MWRCRERERGGEMWRGGCGWGERERERDGEMQEGARWQGRGVDGGLGGAQRSTSAAVMKIS